MVYITPTSYRIGINAHFVTSGNADCIIRPCWVMVCILEMEYRLVESDIPGASLKGRQPSDLTILELKRWLSCRGGTICGMKAGLVKR